MAIPALLASGPGQPPNGLFVQILGKPGSFAPLGEHVANVANVVHGSFVCLDACQGNAGTVQALRRQHINFSF